MLRKVPVLLLVMAACGSVDETPDAALLPDAATLADADIIPPPIDPPPTDPPPPPPSNSPGKHTHELSVGGMTRVVVVYVPELAQGPTRVPAVIAYHGTAQDGEKAYTDWKWREKSDEVGIITVYPTALVHCFHEDTDGDGVFADPAERKVVTKWSQGTLGTDTLPICEPAVISELPEAQRLKADHPQADDIAFTQAILDLLATEYAVDAKRIYATGFSNGGSFTSRLAVEMSDKFAAITASGGTLQVGGVAARAIPVGFTVGENDPFFTEPMNLNTLPLDASLLDVPNWKTLTITPWLAALQLPDSPDVLANAGGVLVSYSMPGGYQHAVIAGLAHQYANGINHPLVYADMFWAFFAKYSLP